MQPARVTQWAQQSLPEPQCASSCETRENCPLAVRCYRINRDHGIPHLSGALPIRDGDPPRRQCHLWFLRPPPDRLSTCHSSCPLPDRDQVPHLPPRGGRGLHLRLAPENL